MPKPHRPTTPTLLALAFVVAAAFTLAGRRDDSPRSAMERAVGSVEGFAGSGEDGFATIDEVMADFETVEAAQSARRSALYVTETDFCRDVGYLCADLSEDTTVVVRRWTRHEGTLVVHVPLPEGEDRTTARAMQQAAAQGIRAWNNQPFPILADLRGDRDPHFAVSWRSALSGRQLGLTRTSWSPSGGLTVLGVELATRQPGASGQAADSRQIRLTAAHEMGHALGLPHSDQRRDVMYATNTATAMSAQDYRSIEVLYATPDGTAVIR